MIIGRGLLAKALNVLDKPNYLFFASGVSNSNETNESEFKRERDLLLSTLKKHLNKDLFLYFSTCSIYDTSVNQRLYVKHKMEMEKLIVNSGVNFLILRVSNLVGEGGNPNTVMNYFVNAVKGEQQFNIWENATRNLLGVGHMVFILKDVMNKNNKNQIIDIAYHKSFKVLDIIKEIENFFKIKSNGLILKNKGAEVNIDTTSISGSLNKINQGINKNNYIEYLLKTYYS